MTQQRLPRRQNTMCVLSIDIEVTLRAEILAGKKSHLLVLFMDLALHILARSKRLLTWIPPDYDICKNFCLWNVRRSLNRNIYKNWVNLVSVQVAKMGKFYADEYLLCILCYRQLGVFISPVWQVHRLTPEELKKREIIYIDIANDKVSSGDYKPEEDPTKFRSEKSGRGPLQGKWRVCKVS